jgi:hypothetical protein
MHLESLVYSTNNAAIMAVRTGLGTDVTISRYDTPDCAIGALAARQFDLVIVDYSAQDAAAVLLAQKVLSRNTKTLSAVLMPVDEPLRVAFDQGSSLAIYDSSGDALRKAFRTIRGLISRDRRGSRRIATCLCASAANDNGDAEVAVIRDISESGAAIQTHLEVKVGDAFRLIFKLPTGDIQIEAACQAVRVGENGSAGVQFKSLSRRNETLLKQWLALQLQQANPQIPQHRAEAAELTPASGHAA